MELPEDIVHQCVNGHVFCAECLKSHRESGRVPACEKCPTCRVALGDQPIRNRIAEKAIGQVPAPCAGCGLVMVRKLLKAHMSTCDEVEIACPFPGCTHRMRRCEVAEHLASAAQAHLALAQAMQTELSSVKETLASLDVKVRVKFSEAPREVAVLLKRMEPIHGQEAWRNCFLARPEHLSRNENDYMVPGTDLTKTPHQLALRDGAIITVKSLILSLKVVDEHGGEIYFRCKMTTPMERLMRAYAQRRQVPVHSFRLVFGDHVVRGEETPGELNMEDGAELDLQLVANAGDPAPPP